MHSTPIALNPYTENVFNGLPMIVECPARIGASPTDFPFSNKFIKRKPSITFSNKSLYKPDIFPQKFRNHA